MGGRGGSSTMMTFQTPAGHRHEWIAGDKLGEVGLLRFRRATQDPAVVAAPRNNSPQRQITNSGNSGVREATSPAGRRDRPDKTAARRQKVKNLCVNMSAAETGMKHDCRRPRPSRKRRRRTQSTLMSGNLDRKIKVSPALADSAAGDHHAEMSGRQGDHLRKTDIAPPAVNSRRRKSVAHQKRNMF
ncbi:hypothetical protein HPP92_029102 [Vanilla planifolia]|uniref:Uncharacterized protein n=1 Tax=Vanilla planifolia TaxID=51239 RepID=A0A835P625_VANPL|nr:hypothetical protein HPP92_029102 [Vanilla planifolia]KAG0445922.1 hypothetical protein HPP92_029091 [Vanilla planifolia]